MTLTIQLAPDLEALLLEQAANAGMDASQFVASTLASQLKPPVASSPHCGKVEADLLAAISLGLPEPLWQRYRFLVSRRINESLTAEEHAELIRLSDQIEQDHADRMANVASLARLRKVPLETLMSQLGIRPPHV